MYVRTEPSTEASVLTMVPIEDDLVVLDESIPGWAKVTTAEGEGYVSTDYVIMTTEFVQAESKEEEAARLAKEEQERQAAAERVPRREEEEAGGHKTRHRLKASRPIQRRQAPTVRQS